MSIFIKAIRLRGTRQLRLWPIGATDRYPKKTRLSLCHAEAHLGDDEAGDKKGIAQTLTKRFILRIG